MKANGEIQVDPRQEVCMKMLDDLAKQIDGYSPKMTRASKPAASVPSGGGGFFGLFGGSKAPPPKAAKAADAPLQPVAGQKGLYLWGGTGNWQNLHDEYAPWPRKGLQVSDLGLHHKG